MDAKIRCGRYRLVFRPANTTAALDTVLILAMYHDSGLNFNCCDQPCCSSPSRHSSRRVDQWVNVGADSPPLLLGWWQGNDRSLALFADKTLRAGVRVLVPTAAAAAQASGSVWAGPLSRANFHWASSFACQPASLPAWIILQQMPNLVERGCAHCTPPSNVGCVGNVNCCTPPCGCARIMQGLFSGTFVQWPRISRALPRYIWHHVALSANATTCTASVDGVLLGSARCNLTAMVDWAWNSTFGVGGFKGAVADLRVSAAIRDTHSPVQVANATISTCTLPSNPVSCDELCL